MSSFRIGIDLGGTKIELVALLIEHHTMKTGKMVHQKRVDTPKGEYLAIIQAITNFSG